MMPPSGDSPIQQHHKWNLSERSKFASCDVFADIFRAHTGPKAAMASVDKLLIWT